MSLFHVWVYFFHAWISSLTYAFWRIGVVFVLVYFVTHGLAVSRMTSHALAFSRIGLPFHAWIGSRKYVFSRMGFFTYGSTFSRMDWLSRVCFLTHGHFHVWVHLFTHGLAVSRMLSHAWALSHGSTLSRMDWLSHVCFLKNGPFSRMGLPFHAWIGSLTYAASRMGFKSDRTERKIRPHRTKP